MEEELSVEQQQALALARARRRRAEAEQAPEATGFEAIPKGSGYPDPPAGRKATPSLGPLLYQEALGSFPSAVLRGAKDVIDTGAEYAAKGYDKRQQLGSKSSKPSGPRRGRWKSIICLV